MAENGAAKYYQQPGSPRPMEVSLELGHQQQLQGGSKCYDDDGRIKGTGNIISFLVILSPLPTFIRVFKKKSTESFQSIPYVLALFSSLLWLYYGLFTWDAMLLGVNAVSCVIESIYLLIYLSYAPKKAMRTTEMAGVVPSVDLKPTQRDWNGAGAQTNYRAKSTFRREKVVCLMLFVLVISNSLPLTGARLLKEKRLSPSLPKGRTPHTFEEGPAFESLPRVPTPASRRSNATSSPNSHNRCPPLP